MDYENVNFTEIVKKSAKERCYLVVKPNKVKAGVDAPNLDKRSNFKIGDSYVWKASIPFVDKKK